MASPVTGFGPNLSRWCIRRGHDDVGTLAGASRGRAPLGWGRAMRWRPGRRSWEKSHPESVTATGRDLSPMKVVAGLRVSALVAAQVWAKAWSGSRRARETRWIRLRLQTGDQCAGHSGLVGQPGRRHDQGEPSVISSRWSPATTPRWAARRSLRRVGVRPAASLLSRSADAGEHASQDSSQPSSDTAARARRPPSARLACHAPDGSGPSTASQPCRNAKTFASGISHDLNSSASLVW